MRGPLNNFLCNHVLIKVSIIFLRPWTQLFVEKVTDFEGYVSTPTELCGLVQEYELATHPFKILYKENTWKLSKRDR